MQDWIEGLMNYPGILFLMALENIFPPIPSELIMPLAGFKSGKRELGIVGVIVCGTIGSLIGQTVLYIVALKVGEDRLRHFIEKYGEWLALSPEDLDKGKSWFERHGEKMVLLGRVVPGIRSLISIPAGLANMPLPKFLLFSGIGTLAWTACLGLLGYFLGERYQGVERTVGVVANVILGGMLLCFIFQIIKRRREKGHRQARSHP